MAALKKRVGAAKDEYASGDMNTFKKGGSKLCRTEFYLWVTTDIVRPSRRPQSIVGQLISDKYDAWVRQFESDTELRQKQLALKTRSKAIKSMRAIVSANLKPYVDGDQLTNQLAMMETMFNASWQTNVTVGSLNKNQVKLYHVQIDLALIAIALEDQPAQLFLLNSEDLALYWQQFLLRLRLWQQQQT